MSGSDRRSIRAAHDGWRLAVQPTGSDWQARNPGRTCATVAVGLRCETEKTGARYPVTLDPLAH